MKTMTALAAMLFLHACGSAPADGNDAVAASQPRAAAETAAPVETGATPANSSTPIPAAEDDATGQEKTRVEELAGNWRIVRVRAAPGPVQAVSDDDPNLMGAVLSISPDRLTWKAHKGGFFTDTCPGPQIGPDDSIGCAEGQFGPPEAHLTGEGSQLRLDWYDGAILTLSRQ
jgi:hypothetical protein